MGNEAVDEAASLAAYADVNADASASAELRMLNKVEFNVPRTMQIIRKVGHIFHNAYSTFFLSSSFFFVQIFIFIHDKLELPTLSLSLSAGALSPRIGLSLDVSRRGS